MIAAVVAGVASLVVAVVTAFAPLRSAKQQREIALLEIDLLQKLTPGTGAHLDLETVLRFRIERWRRSASRPLAYEFDTAVRLVAICAPFLILSGALLLYVEPKSVLSNLRGTATFLLWGITFPAATILTVVSFLLIIKMIYARVRAMQKRRRRYTTTGSSQF